MLSMPADFRIFFDHLANNWFIVGLQSAPCMSSPVTSKRGRRVHNQYAATAYVERSCSCRSGGVIAEARLNLLVN